MWTVSCGPLREPLSGPLSRPLSRPLSCPLSCTYGDAQQIGGLDFGSAALLPGQACRGDVRLTPISENFAHWRIPFRRKGAVPGRTNLLSVPPRPHQQPADQRVHASEAASVHDIVAIQSSRLALRGNQPLSEATRARCFLKKPTETARKRYS